MGRGKRGCGEGEEGAWGGGRGGGDGGGEEEERVCSVYVCMYVCVEVITQ